MSRFSRAAAMTTGQLIRHYREIKGLNQSELARRIGIRPQSVQEWEAHTTTPNARRVPAIAAALGVEPRDLAPGAPLRHEGPEAPERVSAAVTSTGLAQDLPTLREFHATVQAEPVTGAVTMRKLRPIAGPEPGVELIVVSPAWAARMLPGCNPNALRVTDALGDSMEPTLPAGSWVFVETDARRVDVDGIWVLKDRNGEYFIKRVQRRLDNTWLVLSDNPAYPPMTVGPELQRELEVLGRVRLAAPFKHL